MRPKVMIIEDEELIGLFVRETLEPAGYDVVAFAEAKLALQHLQTTAVACAIVDVGLPDLPGDELVHSIRRCIPNLPILLSTGYSASQYERSFADDPWLRVLAKPYNETRLLLEVEALIGTSPSRRTLQASTA